MSRRNIIVLTLILLLTGMALAGILVRSYNVPVLGKKGLPDKSLGMSLGLDLSGGVHLVYEADLSQKDPTQTDAEAMAGIMDKIQRRINAYGVSEPIIQKQGTDRVSVELPGITNVKDAETLIGSTAELKFVARTVDATGKTVDTDTGLTGKDLKRAFVGTYQGSDPTKQGEIVVNFEFQSAGAQIFSTVTSQLAGKGQIAIYLDNVEITAPRVISAIPNGTGFIEGNFTLDSARTLAIELNEGALPVPLGHFDPSGAFKSGPATEEKIDPTLGKVYIDKSLLAGIIGLSMVIVFMILYYRLPGVMASFALMIYAILMLMFFKLVPVTLTLASIAGFVLSIGMAVDANVLIFERLKEELRAGRSLGSGIEIGFNRAWSAIRDSNVSTLITCAILYWLGSTFGETSVMGFALTLGIGVLLSMFSAITVTRNFMRFLVGSRFAKRLSLFGVNKPEAEMEPVKEQE